MGLVAEVGGFECRMWRFPFFSSRLLGCAWSTLTEQEDFPKTENVNPET